MKGAMQCLLKPVSMSDLRNLWQLAFVWKQTNGLVVRGFGWEPQEQHDMKRKQPQKVRKTHEDREKRPKVTAVDALDTGRL